MARRKAREYALQLLFQSDITLPGDIEQVESIFWELLPLRENEKVPSDDVRRYAHFLYTGAWEHKLQIDELIQKYSEHWRIERMAAVDRNILRIAIFEFLFEPETPPTVIINEALEIARKFSATESTQFINGILDAINKHHLPASRQQTS